VKRIHRVLAAGIGVAAIALSAAALAGPAAAAPSSSPSPTNTSSPTNPSGPTSPSASPSGAPGSPGTRPGRPTASPSTSDSAPTGKVPAAPTAVVYDMSVAASDVTFVSDGPAHGTTANVSIAVRNNGTAAQHGLTVTVLEPSDAHLTGIQPGASGIDGCVAGTVGDGRGAITCQVHDAGPGHQEMASFGLTGDVPLPASPAHPNGSVILHGFHAPNAHPDDTSVRFAVRAIDSSQPERQVDLRITAGDVTMRRGGDGRWHGTVPVTFVNRGNTTVPAVMLEILPPAGVTLDGPSDDGFPYPCVRISGDDVLHNLHRQSGLRCSLGSLAPGVTSVAGFSLSSDAARSDPVPGQVSVYPSDSGAVDPRHLNQAGFHVTFASPSGGPSGQAAGSGTSLPVTGTPLALIAGGGAVVLAAGGALLVLGRRRRLQSPKT
jgi:hypothetical protein